MLQIESGSADFFTGLRSWHPIDYQPLCIGLRRAWQGFDGLAVTFVDPRWSLSDLYWGRSGQQNLVGPLPAERSSSSLQDLDQDPITGLEVRLWDSFLIHSAKVVSWFACALCLQQILHDLQ